MWLMVAGLVGCPGGKESVEQDDTSGDTDSGTVPSEVWAHCPGAEAWAGDGTWQGRVEAGPGALYCSASNDARTLPQELAVKAQLRVIGGAWGVPDLAGEYALSLPLCTLRADGGNPAISGAGATAVSPASFGGVTYTYLEGSQPMLDSAGAGWTLDHTMILVGPEGSVPEPLVLDGRESDAETGSGAVFTLYRDSGTAFDLDAATFGPCMDPTWAENLHTVAFDGGEIALTLLLGDDVVITSPGNFVQATGTLDGTAFEVSDFFRLVYRPGHHHLTRHFAVLFDAPVGEACGLLIEEVDAQQGTTTAVVHTADCALNPLDARAVQAEGWEIR